MTLPNFSKLIPVLRFQDGVFRMSLSPDGALLAVIHFSGRLSLWDVPSLKQRAAWSQDQQVAAERSLSSVEQKAVCVCLCEKRIFSECFETVSACVFRTVTLRVCVCVCMRACTGSVNRVSRLISTPPLSIFFFFSLSSLSLRSLHPPPGSSPPPQPGFEEINPEWKTSLERRKKIKGTAARRVQSQSTLLLTQRRTLPSIYGSFTHLIH